MKLKKRNKIAMKNKTAKMSQKRKNPQTIRLQIKTRRWLVTKMSE
jgi:hypothetical protein